MSAMPDYSAAAAAIDALDLPISRTVSVLLKARDAIYAGMKQLPVGDAASGNVFAQTLMTLDDLIVEELRATSTATGAPIRLVTP